MTPPHILNKIRTAQAEQAERMTRKNPRNIPSTHKIWTHWIARTLLVCCGLGILLVIFNAAVNFHAHSMTSATPSEHTDTSPAETVSVVTFNTWRFCDSERVPAMMHALKTIGHTFHPEATEPRLPDILLFQELECQISQDRLQEALDETHWFTANVRARN